MATVERDPAVQSGAARATASRARSGAARPPWRWWDRLIFAWVVVAGLTAIATRAAAGFPVPVD